MTYVATEFTYGVPEKIALDFGMGMMSLSSVAIAIFFGSVILAKDIETRTIYMVISRPLSRYSFYAWKSVWSFWYIICKCFDSWIYFIKFF